MPLPDHYYPFCPAELMVRKISVVSPVDQRLSQKRHAFMLPGFCSWNSKALAELCAQFCVDTTQMRKEQMIDALFEIDNAATFGEDCAVSCLKNEDLLLLCVKARVRYYRQKKMLPQGAFPSFDGLWDDLTSFGPGTHASSSE